jgi:ATP-binding cassette subfamily F protein 3
VMATIVWQRPNLLLLDEPTNHLDLNTREALSIALNEFEGSVMLVSHDRSLLREVCDEFWLITSGGVLPFDGDLDDYQKWLLDVSRANARGLPPPPVPGYLPAAPAPEPVRAVAPAATPKSVARAAADNASAPGSYRRDERKQTAQTRSQAANRSRPLRNEVTQIDSRMESLGAERVKLEAQLASGKLSGADIAEAGRELNHISAELGRLEERWLELQTEIEAITADSMV